MQPTRRDILRYSAAALVAARVGTAAEEGAEVNDVHSQLNSTRVAKIVRPRSVEELRATILRAREDGLLVSVSGSRAKAEDSFRVSGTITKADGSAVYGDGYAIAG